MSKQEEALVSSLFLLFKETRALFVQVSHECGLGYAQGAALKRLWHSDGLTVSELGEKLSIKSSTITALVDRLERDGYVTRRRDKADRRVVRVFLTPKGAGLKDKVQDFEVYFADLIKDVLTEEEMAGLHQPLDKLRRAVEGRRNQG